MLWYVSWTEYLCYIKATEVLPSPFCLQSLSLHQSSSTQTRKAISKCFSLSVFSICRSQQKKKKSIKEFNEILSSMKWCFNKTGGFAEVMFQ